MRAEKLPSASEMVWAWWVELRLTSRTWARGRAAPGAPVTVASPRPSGGPTVIMEATGGS